MGIKICKCDVNSVMDMFVGVALGLSLEAKKILWLWVSSPGLPQKCVLCFPWELSDVFFFFQSKIGDSKSCWFIIIKPYIYISILHTYNISHMKVGELTWL
jgi:hypothetical protein